ncbi:efflux RND transporter periplasmic adaptor subunit [Palleronia sp. KMU-117]|uniref:efflux RND transporter periplasmic adaptor subunit n=1 Tax=Palleronia sp. KMU-117 TaxID=3434108 RepID=UPI003D717D8E
MRFLGRSLTGVFLLALTVGLLALAGSSVWRALEARWAQDPGAVPARERVFAVNVVEVRPETVTPVIEVFGEVQSRRRLELRAAAGGEVIQLSDRFEDGGAVRAGDLLLRIDPFSARSARDVANVDLREAEADLADARRALELARDALAATGEQAVLRERALERQRDLLGRAVGTDAAVETAELAASAARQAVLAARQGLAQAEARIEQAETTVDRRRIALAEAERRLAETEVFAAFDGILNDVSLVEGRLVNANERLGELVDPTALEVAFRVSTAQYARLSGPDGQVAGLPVTVALDVLGLDLTVAGRVTRESAAAGDGQTGRLLYATLDPAPGFRPGDFVSVIVAEPPLDSVAVLPASAVSAAGEALVVGPDDRLEAVPVAILRRQGDTVLVPARGLAGDLAGARVVAERTPLLGAGIRVRVFDPAGSGEQASAARPAASPDEMLELDPDRRARLVAFVEASVAMPAEAKARILDQLAQDRVPAEMVARIESRMGG